MSQHDGVLDNAPGATFRADANAALAAILGLSSGTSAPSTTYAYMLWADTTNTLLKQRNAANSAWITVGTLDATNLGLLALTGGTLTGALTMSGKPLLLAKGAAVASGATADIWSPADGNLIHITGTSAISSFGTAPQAGSFRICIADAACSLTHGSNLVLPGAANITLAAEDIFVVFADTTTKHRVLGPFFAAGFPTSMLRDDAVTLAKMAHGTRGDLIKYGVSGAPAYLALGTAGQFLKSDGTDTVWGAGGVTPTVKQHSATTSGTTVTVTGLTADEIEIHFNDVSGSSNGTEYRIELSSTNGSSWISSGLDSWSASGNAEAYEDNAALWKLVEASPLDSSVTFDAVIRITGLRKVSTNARKGYQMQGFASDLQAFYGGGRLASTAAIDAIRISINTGSFDAGSVTIIER